MTDFNCPNCGGQVYRGADKCPYCGTAFKHGITLPIGGGFEDVKISVGNSVTKLRGYIADMSYEIISNDFCTVRDMSGHIKVIPAKPIHKIYLEIVAEGIDE